MILVYNETGSGLGKRLGQGDVLKGTLDSRPRTDLSGGKETERQAQMNGDEDKDKGTAAGTEVETGTGI